MARTLAGEALRGCGLCWRDVFVAMQRGEASSTNLSCCDGPCQRWGGAKHCARLGYAELTPVGGFQWSKTIRAGFVLLSVAALLTHHAPMSAGDQKGGGALPVLGVRPAPGKNGGSCFDRALI